MRADKAMPPLSRSDLVRQRRQQRSTQRITRSRVVASQPVITRSQGTFAAHPLPQKSKSRVKRRYYYSLGASGAELRLPAMPLLHPGSKVLSTIIVVLAALAIYVLSFSAEFQISEVTVEGITRLASSDIEAVLGAHGKQVVTFDPLAAQTAIENAFPELTNVRVQVGFPATIKVKVTEMQPVIAWNAAGNTYWIDPTGVILPPRGEPGALLTVGANALPPLLPDASQDEQSIESPDGTPAEVWGRKVDLITLSRIIELYSLIPPGSKLVYNSVNGIGWEEPSGLDIYIGQDLTNFDLKMSIYKAITTSLEQRGIMPQDMISVEYINTPFYR